MTVHAVPTRSTLSHHSPNLSLALTAHASAFNDPHSSVYKNSTGLDSGWDMAVAGAGAIASFAFDRTIQEFSQRPSFHTEGSDHFSDAFAFWGTEGSYLAIVSLLLGSGLIFRNKDNLYAGGELLGGLILGEGAAQGLKLIAGRLRPYQTSDPGDFFHGGTSFPSAHTVVAFSFATILAKNFPRQDLSFIGLPRNVPLIPVLAYTLASSVAVQRIYSNHHWFSDVCFGALTGFTVGSLMVRWGSHVRTVGIRTGLKTLTGGGTPCLSAIFYLD